MPKEKKATSIEVDKRIRACIKGILSSQTTSDMLKFFVEKQDIEISYSSVEKYMSRARERIDKAATIDLTREIGSMKLQLDDLYARALSIQDYKTCNQILKNRADFLDIKGKMSKEEGDTADASDTYVIEPV